MKAYIHKGSGHYIGSCVVVLAESPLDAVQMIREDLDAGGLKHEPVTIQGLQEFPLDKPAVLHFDSGDY